MLVRIILGLVHCVRTRQRAFHDGGSGQRWIDWNRTLSSTHRSVRGSISLYSGSLPEAARQHGMTSPGCDSIYCEVGFNRARLTEAAATVAGGPESVESGVVSILLR